MNDTQPMETEISDMHLIARARSRGGLSWRSPGGPIYQCPLLLIFIVAIAAPEDVVRRNQMVGRFTASIREVLMSLFAGADIGRFSESTKFSEVALLVCALHWTWLIISIFATAIIFEVVRAKEGYVVWKYLRGGGGRLGWRDLWLVLGSVMVCPAALLALTASPGDWSLVKGLATDSRLGFGLLLWAAFWVSGIALGFVYPSARAFIDINLKEK
ncbi:hypothetical protein I5803_20400 [Caenimonas sp. DR4.4]|uniref:Uncharacterized protein n=1 Tax=Caenimonas aquaedulcis TaxID=2793270 RepID=A0A931H8C6_9BURK|nr:hypothetical protein [Caenimonas aquaedulcis]